MNYRDANQLAQEAWDTIAEPPYAATTIDHQLRLCTIVDLIATKLEEGADVVTSNSAGLEDFEAEVVRRMTALVPAPAVEVEVIGKSNKASKAHKK